MRLFISAELPDRLKENIDKITAELKNSTAAVKWVEARNLHLTLKFLGWVKDQELDHIIAETGKAAAKTGSFKAAFSGLGAFPDGKSIRVIWVGTVKGGDELCRLAKDLEETLSKAGYRKEEREFKPHLTIGRVKEKQRLEKLKEKIESLKAENFGEALIDRIYIMKSTLTRKGPIYEIIKEVKLS